MFIIIIIKMEFISLFLYIITRMHFSEIKFDVIPFHLIFDCELGIIKMLTSEAYLFFTQISGKNLDTCTFTPLNPI